MDYDYDEHFRKAIEDGVDSLVKSLTPEQIERLAENVDEVMAAAVSNAMDATAKGWSSGSGRTPLGC